MTFTYIGGEMNFSPVEGWIIEKTSLGICVLECPDFIKYTFTKEEIKRKLGINDGFYRKHRHEIIAQIRARGCRVVKAGRQNEQTRV